MFGQKKIGKKEFSNIYDQYVEKIYRFVFLKVSSKEIAEDLTSQSFLKFWENRAGVKEPRSFLYRIARNLVIDFYRQRKKSPIYSDEILEAITDEKMGIEERVIWDSQTAEIKNALGTINKDHAEAIILHYLEDLSMKETASVLERPEGTIRVMLHRGLEELRQKLGENKLI
ncbi:MAG: RNA polymerase sigma factor [Candidatus Marinimicrobia bacterium]|nr:RNA polymerase sigma factor [Candidatus Neomarinimicrobiota bacterium]